MNRVYLLGQDAGRVVLTPSLGLTFHDKAKLARHIKTGYELPHYLKANFSASTEILKSRPNLKLLHAASLQVPGFEGCVYVIPVIYQDGHVKIETFWRIKHCAPHRVLILYSYSVHTAT
jgi:hypothetical protein